MMECLCGYRFCYECGCPGANCSCSPEGHYFWDNCLDRQAMRQAPPRATPDRDNGLINLQSHIAQRKREAHAVRVRADRRCQRQDREAERMDDSNWNTQWLYRSGGRESTNRILHQIYTGTDRTNSKSMQFGVVRQDVNEEMFGVGAIRYCQ